MNKNISQILIHGEKKLLDKGIASNKQEANLDTSILLAHVLSKPRVYINTWPDKILTKGQVSMFNVLLERRAKGEPIAYIIGQKEFFSLIFNVNEQTLIPRPETEMLVEYILDKFKDNINTKLNILDLGTGSGIIAISIAKARPNWNIIAIDLSLDALFVAKQNAELHGVNNIKFIQSNWFENIDNSDFYNKFDCIVSNPPYIQSDDKHLSEGDVRFEPREALVADNQGLSDIENIINNSQKFLLNKSKSSGHGFLIFEHGYNQLEDIKLLFNKLNLSDNFKFNNIKDYSNQDRAVVL